MYAEGKRLPCFSDQYKSMIGNLLTGLHIYPLVEGSTTGSPQAAQPVVSETSSDFNLGNDKDEQQDFWPSDRR